MGHDIIRHVCFLVFLNHEAHSLLQTSLSSRQQARCEDEHESRAQRKDQRQMQNVAIDDVRDARKPKSRAATA